MHSCVGAHRRDSEISLRTGVFANRWRNQGVGRALAEQAEAWARAEGCVEMASDTTPDYPLSPAVHAALGYQEVERYFRKELLAK